MDKQVTLDEVLDKFSLLGRYQVKFIFLAVFCFATNGLSAYHYIFTAEKSGYICRDEGFSSETCSSLNGTPCGEWIYNDPQSFVAEFNLACEEWKRSLVGTIHSIGYMLGLVLIGPLADRLGRKPIIAISGFLGGVLGLAKSYIHSYWLYITFEFLETALGDTYLTFYVLKLEMVSAKQRVVFSAICSVGYAIGSSIIPLAAWSIPYWRHLLRAIYTPCCFLIAYIFLLDESPRWLLTGGKREKTIALVKKIATTNKVKLDLDLNNLVVEDSTEKVGIGKLLKITFGSRTLLKRCIICIVWWSTSTFVSYGMNINSVLLQGNKYVNFVLVDVLKFPSYLIVTYIMLKFKRRNPLISTFLTGSILCLIHPLIPKGNSWLSLMIYMISKFMCNLFFGITYMYTSELFPTYTRNSMQGFCSSVGRIGAIVAPLTPLLVTYWEGFPTILFGGTSLIAGLLTFLVPDIANDCLPDTVTDAEAVGKKNKETEGIDNLAMSDDMITRENSSVIRVR